MTTENISSLANDNHSQMEKYELDLLKDKLTSRISHLLEEKEAFNSEISRLNDAIMQSKEDRTFLIQSLTQSTYSDDENRSHSMPLLPKRDEFYKQRNHRASPTLLKKSIRVLNKDEDYVERRGRKPKTLRVSIPISDIELPQAAKDNMIHSRIRDRRSIKNSPTNQLLTKPKDDGALPCMVNSTPDLHTQANILEMLKTNSDDISMYGGDVEASQYKRYTVKSIGKDLPYKNAAAHLNVNENGAELSSVERSPKTCPKLAPNLELFKEFDKTPSSDI